LSPLPHEGVYTRLGASGIHGVGVFAVAPIPKGTNLFANDQGAIAWISMDLIDREGLSAEMLKLYYDFDVVRGGLIGVPENFNCLTTGWYVNEPAPGTDANVAMSDDFHFYAVRDIAEGEEVTATYAGFSEPPHLRGAGGETL
jgi:hypothetical protein